MVDPSQILSERNAAVEQIRGFMDLTEEARAANDITGLLESARACSVR
jgi:hypothetical protein